MEHQSGSALVDVIARRVREVRARHGMTAQQLADKLRESGVPWDRATVTKLETGRRQNVTVGEMFALARALDVAPVHLMVPVEGQRVEVTPNEVQDAERVRSWVRGLSTLPGTNLRIFYSEAPVSEFRDDVQAIRDKARELSGKDVDEATVLRFLEEGTGGDSR